MEERAAEENFADLVAKEDLAGFGKLLYGSDTAEDINESFPNEVQQAQTLLKKWVNDLTCGETIDLCTPPYKVWYNVKLLQKQDGDHIYLIHYNGWGKNADETVDLSNSWCLPAHTMTKPKKKTTPRAKMSYFYVQVVTDEDKPPSPDPLAACGTRSGRPINSVPFNGQPQPSNHEKKRPPSPIKEIQEETIVQVKKTKKQRKLSLEDEADWICTECGDTEAPDGSDLLLCEGGCKRSFHLQCLGINSEAEREKMIAGDAWFCNDCIRHRHTCAICHDEGDDGTEVIKCGFSSCGKYYHFGCLTSQAKHYTISQKKQRQDSLTPSPTTESQLADENESGDIESSGWGEYQLVYCPLHFCAVCSDFYQCIQSTYRDRIDLKPCYRCPRAFHKRCIPPDCRHNELMLLCGNHLDEHFPPSSYDVPHTGSDGATELVRSYKQGNISASHLFDDTVFSGLKFGPIFAQLQLPQFFPNPLIPQGSHFRLPVQIQNDIHALPPSFKIIFTNDYEPLLKSNIKIPFHDPGEDVQCCCTVECDEGCLNRISKIECCETKSKSICALGDKNCGNRQFSSRQYVKVQPFREGEMGWGLRALEDVPEGTLVIEYVGEIISEAQMRERMEQQRIDTPNDHDFYIMELETGIYVDGKKKGNLSRFINHSCDPNCELSRWVVKGRTRIGIFAIRDIACNEPLSYDYQFDTQETDAFKCHCGTDKCRGTMAPKQKIISKENLSRADRQKLIAAGKRLEDKSVLQREEWKKSYTGKNLPGDKVLEIKNGPCKGMFEEGRAQRIFLVRNVMAGMDFLQRREKLWRKAEKKIREEKEKIAHLKKRRSGSRR